MTTAKVLAFALCALRTCMLAANLVATATALPVSASASVTPAGRGNGGNNLNPLSLRRVTQSSQRQAFGRLVGGEQAEEEEDGRAPALPKMRYRFTSFATSDPLGAANFCEKYFDAVAIKPSQYLTHKTIAVSATVSAVRFHFNGGKDFHDVYFVRDPTKPSGAMTPDQYVGYLHKTHHFEIEETWDWYQDWHLCFNVDNLDLVAYRLLQDKVPFVTRSSYSFYVEIPFGITFQFLGPKMGVVWSELFNFCRFTDGTGKLQQLQIADIPSTLPPLPELPPAHHSYFSNKADVAFNFTLKHTSGTPYDMSGVWRESHRYSDGRCALLRWVQYDGFQVHFVEQYHKYQGAITTQATENMLEALHGDMSRIDAFFDYRVGFEVEDLAPYQRSLEADGVSYLMAKDEASLFMQLPGGMIFEIIKAPDMGLA